MTILKLCFLLLFSISIYAKPILIDDKTDFYDLLPNSQIYIDKSKSLRLKDIQNKNSEFKDNDKKLLGYGYSPDFNVWVKFTLKNKTNKTIEKTLEYDNALTTKVQLFNSNTDYLGITDGLFNMSPKRNTINPIFKILINPFETKTFYVKTASHIMPLIIKLHLWESSSFYGKEIKHQLYLALFFGAMIILALYNLFIFFFTKDISYLYYVLYIVGVVIHHTLYVGVASIYILSQTWMVSVIEFASVFVVFPIFALALFCKSFLQTKQYPIFHKILNIYLLLIPISLVVFMTTNILHQYRNAFFISLLLYLIFLTIYASYKKNRQAYFILFGWFVILVAWVFMYLSSTGAFNIYEYFPYFVEVSLVLEAIIFSIALADRINHLQKDKVEANAKLITQQENEKQRLEIKVTEKTKDLNIALDEKGLLLKELNHRVKNNMQMIVSLIRLQCDEIEDEKLQDIFLTIQNRINAMSHLHELLYKQENISYINAYEYFSVLIEELQDSYDKEIDIKFNIETQLKMEQSVYCGIILNELITNCFKYAFPDDIGEINISLTKEDGIFKLLVSDNGTGYDINKHSDSLGLILVDTLAKKQLRGELLTECSNGVTVTITWRNDD